jgi:hypothetical protein
MNRSVDFSVEGFDASLLSQADQISDRVDAKPLHDAAAVDFDGFLGNVKL